MKLLGKVGWIVMVAFDEVCQPSPTRSGHRFFQRPLPGKPIPSNMILRRNPSLGASVLMAVLAATGMAAEKVAVDWRLELLSRDGVSSETPALQEMEKRFTPSEERLENAVGRLGAEEFRTREQAQHEILTMGKEALPWLRRQPRIDDPEVRVRLGQIERTLGAGGRWTKEDLLHEAVTSTSLPMTRCRPARSPRRT